MKISTRGRYALRLMVDIGQNCADRYVTLKEVAARQDISTKYLEQITTKLSKANLVVGLRGSMGGYKLTRDPKEYTVGDILRAAEGSIVPVECLQTKNNKCGRCNNCTTIGFWNKFSDLINEYVDSVTLHDLIEDAKEEGKV
jgi:Rrf2 family protein